MNIKSKILFLLVSIVLLNNYAIAQTISAGTYHSLAICKDSTVMSWGANWWGQLGIGYDTNQVQYLPVQVVGQGEYGVLDDIIAVAAGNQHSLALKDDGTVWAWGYNTSGRLGDGTTSDRYFPIQVKGLDGIGYLSNIIIIGGGFDHSLALKGDGTVWAWGSNLLGQLGDSTINNRLTPIQVKGANELGYLTNIISISTGASNSFALKDDGTIWAWGTNNGGRLGDGTTIDKWVPVCVSGQNGLGYLTNIITISKGSVRPYAIKKDGTVWSWGWNKYNNTGDGTTINRLTPVQPISLCEMIPSSIPESSFYIPIYIYPNPSNGQFILEIMNTEQKITNYQIKILNLLGQTVHQQTIYTKQETLNTKLSKGIYTLQLVSKKGMMSKKIVVQ